MPMAHLSGGGGGGGGGLNASKSYDSWGVHEANGRIGQQIAGSMSETRFNDGPEVSRGGSTPIFVSTHNNFGCGRTR